MCGTIDVEDVFRAPLVAVFPAPRVTNIFADMAWPNG
jgi:hypothetical protein